MKVKELRQQLAAAEASCEEAERAGEHAALRLQAAQERAASEEGELRRRRTELEARLRSSRSKLEQEHQECLSVSHSQRARQSREELRSREEAAAQTAAERQTLEHQVTTLRRRTEMLCQRRDLASEEIKEAKARAQLRERQQVELDEVNAEAEDARRQAEAAREATARLITKRDAERRAAAARNKSLEARAKADANALELRLERVRKGLEHRKEKETEMMQRLREEQVFALKEWDHAEQSERLAAAAKSETHAFSLESAAAREKLSLERAEHRRLEVQLQDLRDEADHTRRSAKRLFLWTMCAAVVVDAGYRVSDLLGL